MSHREREIVPDGRTNERKGTLSLESLTTVRNTEDASVSRGAESSNLVFYSAFYRQPVQIHKKGGDMFLLGNLADKTSSAVHHTLNFVYEFLRNTSQQGIAVI